MRKVTMIDLPHGWRYGFPKPPTLGEGQSLQDWLIENGYPQAEINVFGITHLPCRYWTREVEERPSYELNAHDIGERMKLILARRHVAALRANPDLIIQAQAENNRQLASHRATIGNRAWRFLLRRSIDEIIAHMLQKSPTGRTLRSTSPFSMILPPESEAERRRMWRAAKAELLADYLSGGKGIRNFQLRRSANRDATDEENCKRKSTNVSDFPSMLLHAYLTYIWQLSQAVA